MDNNFRKEYLIQKKDDLDFLKTIKSLFYKYDEVKIELEKKGEVFSKEWENKINIHYKACGCGEGKFFVLLFFMAALQYLYVKNHLFFSYSNFGFVFLMCLLGAFIGKGFGQYLAHVKLKKVLTELESFL